MKRCLPPMAARCTSEALGVGRVTAGPGAAVRARSVDQPTLLWPPKLGETISAAGPTGVGS